MPISRDGALEYYTYINTEQFKKDIREMIQGIDRVGDKTEKETGKMDAAFKKVSTAIAGYFSFQAAKGFVTQLVRIRGEFQQLNIALETMLGNKEKADALMEQIKELAATTPFQLTDVATGAKQLLAYGFAADTVIGTMRKLGDLAAGVSAPLGDIVYLYGTLRAQGRAYTQDIRQFTNRGIPILQELVKVLGVDSVAAVNKMVTAGQVGFPEVEKALHNLTGEGGQFFNLMAKQSKSLTGQISNLQDQFEFMLNDLGKSSEGFISGGIEAASDLISHYKEILKTIGTIAAAYGVYRAALVATIAIERIQQAVSLEMAAAQGTLNAAQAAGIIVTGNLRKAWLFLTAAIEANPIGAVIAALTALYLGFEALMPRILTAKEAITELGTAGEHFSEQMKRASEIDDLLSSYDKLAQEAKKGKDVQDELNETMLKINDIVPGVASQWDHLGNVIAINTSKVKDYSKSLRDMTIEQLEAVKTRTANVLGRYQEMIKPLQETLSSGQARRGINTPFGFIDLYKVDATAEDIANATEKAKTLKPKIKQLKDRLKETRELISRLGYGIDTRSDEEKQEESFESLLKGVSVNFKKLIEVAQNKDDLNKIKQGLQAKLDALAPSDAQTSELKDKILRVNKILDSYKVVAPKKVKPKLKITPVPELDDEKFGTTIKALMDKSDEEINKEIAEWAPTITASAPNMRTAFEILLEDPINDSLKSLKSKIAAIDELLANGILTPAQTNRLREIQRQLEHTAHTGSDIYDRMRELPPIFNDLGQSVSGFDVGLGHALNIMGGIVSRAVDFQKSIGEAKEGFKDFGNQGGIGNLIGGIAGGLGAIGAVAGIVTNIVGAIKQQQEEMDRRRAEAIKKQNEMLQKQYELTQKINGVEQVSQQIELIKKAQEDRIKKAQSVLHIFQNLNKSFSGIFSSEQSKEWEQNIRSAISNNDWDKLSLIIDDIQTGSLEWSESAKATFEAIQNDVELIEKITEKLKETFTGISLSGLTDQIVAMFEDGKASAEDFADTFEGVMKGAILNTFKRNFLAKQLEGWYDDFAKLSRSGDQLTDAEVAQLQEALQTIVDNANQGLKQLSDAAGIDFGTKDKTGQGLAGAIQRSITEDTATELSGRINGMYLMAKKSSDTVSSLLSVQKAWQQKQMQQLSLSIRHLAGIESNTLKTANNSVYLSYLKSIDGKLSNGNDAKKAAGVK